jgi:SAM-dependent methyltransferase
VDITFISNRLAEDPEFWTTVADAVFDEPRVKLANHHADQVLALLARENHHPKRVLDIGCGEGQHVLAMARRGLQCTGIDMVPCFIEAAKIAAQGMTNVSFVCRDVRDYLAAGTEGEFDLAFTMFTTVIGYLPPAENVVLLRQIRAALAPGGKLVIDSVNRSHVTRVCPVHFPKQSGGQITLAILLDVPGRPCTVRYEIFSPGVPTHIIDGPLWLYTEEQLSEQLRAAGFGEIEILGSLDGEPYDVARSSRLISIASR